MREHKGDLWRVKTNAYVITTNFSVRKDGHAVMGRGCALEALEKWPDTAIMLGALNKWSRKVNILRVIKKDRLLISYPVKLRWFEKASPELVVQSADQLRTMINLTSLETVAMPRPGCGNGQLDWKDVKPLIEEYLDDRFIVCHYDTED